MDIGLPSVIEAIDAARPQYEFKLDWGDMGYHIVIASLVMNFFWALEDRSNPKKCSNIFTLISSCACGSMSTAFVFTADPWYSTVAHAWFIAGMLMDFTWGYIYFPEYMHIATTTIHHAAYLVMEWYLMRCHLAAVFSVYFPQEIPTFQLHIKRYFDIKNNAYETLFGITFMTLRIFYYMGVSYMLRREIMADYFYSFAFVAVGFMHLSWFADWSAKYFQRLRGHSKSTKKIE